MLRTEVLTLPEGTGSVNGPSSLMVPLMVLPSTDTWPDVTGSDVSESVTLPVITRVWADAGRTATRQSIAIKHNLRPITHTSSKVDARPMRAGEAGCKW